MLENGGDGDERLSGGTGADEIYGGAGIDQIDGGRLTDDINRWERRRYFRGWFRDDYIVVQSGRCMLRAMFSSAGRALHDRPIKTRIDLTFLDRGQLPQSMQNRRYSRQRRAGRAL